MTTASRPRAWKAADVARDRSWIQRLTPDEVDGFRTALAHARQANKPLLDMQQRTSRSQQHPASRSNARLRHPKPVGHVPRPGLPDGRVERGPTCAARTGVRACIWASRGRRNRASEVINDVRDAGGSYKVKGGRGYNTNAGLDFHQDSCDVVALLCRRTAKSGGTSKVVSSIAVRERVRELRPDLLPVLQDANWFHSFQSAQDPSQPAFYRCPIFGSDERFFCARTNRKNTVAAQVDFPEVPRLTAQQQEALDLLDGIMSADEYCYSMELERGDMQLLNSFVTLHSRTPFEDHADADAKRHLMRLWMSIPTSQPLPLQWAEYWGDVRAGAVRGGVRGTAITAEFLAYEKRQAEAMKMLFAPWKPVVDQEEMRRILAAQGP
ncbi:hypothetical protein DFH09DRAFT_1236399 [Mycena vulgaris]|nr:hypothetical protein DFH09DRAFT_1236399 [Mycena vulgaris]